MMFGTSVPFVSIWVEKVNTRAANLKLAQVGFKAVGERCLLFLSMHNISRENLKKHPEKQHEREFSRMPSCMCQKRSKLVPMRLL